jgi:tRNA/rRNA methyltransferase
MTLDFSRVRFIMTEPSHPGNVGSAARAIKTMGFDELVLVAPKIPDITLEPDAKAPKPIPPLAKRLSLSPYLLP